MCAQVRVSFARANPRFGGVGHEHDVRAPLPDCLRFFLHDRLLKHAKRDSLRDVLKTWKGDAAAQRAFKSREKALRAFFAAMCAKGGGPSSRSVRMDVLLRELETRKVGASRLTPQRHASPPPPACPPLPAAATRARA